MDPIQNFYTEHPYPFSGDHNLYFEKNIYPKVKELNPKKILDAGCGTGGTSACIARCYPSAEILAIDYSKTALEIAKKRHQEIKNLSFDEINLKEPLPFQQEYDFINCHGVLHYFDDPVFVLKQFRRILKNDGFVHLWLFNPYARRGIDDVIELERILAGSSNSVSRRIQAFKAIRKYYTGIIKDEEADRYWEDLDINDESENNRFKYTRLANRYFLPSQPYYYSVETASKMFNEAGFKLEKVIDFAQRKLPNELLSSFETPPTEEITWHVFEVLEQPFGLSYLLKVM